MEKMKKRFSMAGAGCLMMAFCVMLFCGCGSKASSFVVEDTEGGQAGEAVGDDAGDLGNREEGAAKGPEGDPAIEQIYVQVSGAVVNPGVYQLPADSRVFMAVELAGGLSPEADESSLNQAEPLRDGQQIYVYAVGERSQQEAVQESDGRINLNTATAQELMTLPGIGQSKADSIISYRENNGGFEAVEDLMKIDGIKEGVFSKIKDLVRV